MSRTVPESAIPAYVAAVDPAADLVSAAPVERGFSPVFRLVVGTASGEQVWYLKVAPEAEDRGVPADARIMAVLDRHTEIPVPSVRAILDSHPDLATPAFVMDAMPGEELPYEQVGWLADPVLETLADNLGRYLGELHQVEAVESYGHVGPAPGTLGGLGKPMGRVADIGVTEGAETWVEYLRTRIDHELDRHRGSAFADLTDGLETWFDERLDGIEEPPRPVLGRNDHGLHNVLLDPETGSITAMLDWAYTLAVDPAYDFEFAVYLTSGAFMAGLPSVRDRRSMVRKAMARGYEETNPDGAAPTTAGEPCYEVLAMVRIMNDFDQLAPRLPDDQMDAVDECLRADLLDTIQGQA